MMDNLNKFVGNSGNVGQSYSAGDKTYTIAKIDNFSYTDPVDGSVSKNQVICFVKYCHLHFIGEYVSPLSNFLGRIPSTIGIFIQHDK